MMKSTVRANVVIHSDRSAPSTLGEGSHYYASHFKATYYMVTTSSNSPMGELMPRKKSTGAFLQECIRVRLAASVAMGSYVVPPYCPTKLCSTYGLYYSTVGPCEWLLQKLTTKNLGRCRLDLDLTRVSLVQNSLVARFFRLFIGIKPVVHSLWNVHSTPF